MNWANFVKDNKQCIVNRNRCIQGIRLMKHLAPELKWGLGLDE